MDLNSKIVYGLERLSDVFKTLLWEKAKVHGISPIQIQILIFTANHTSEYRNVSHLAKEFNVTKPTISDAVKVLSRKGLLDKEYSSSDSRSYTLFVSEKGSDLLNEISDYTKPIRRFLENTDKDKLESLYSNLTHLIYQLNKSGVLEVQRTCFGCRFYEKGKTSHRCKLLETNLRESDIRLDCPEFEEVN